MDLYVMNQSFETIGIIDSASSVIWNQRFFDCGDFEIYLRADKETVSLLKENYYIYRLDHEMVGIIENKTITTSAEEGNYYTITGRFLESILSRRIAWNQTTISGNAEECIRQLITDNVISPEDPKRKIENFLLDEKVGFTETIKDFDLQSNGENLLETITVICKTYKIGYKVTLTPENQFLFSLYRGEDRSYGQNVNNYVVFSPEFDNLISSEYTYNRDEYRNAAIVVGEGEGTSQKRVSIGETSGLLRYEARIDGSGVSSNGEIITAQTYEKMLIEYGKEQLGTYKIIEGISGEVENNSTYQADKDYFLGDIVSVENEYGIGADTRVIEILENEDESGYKIVPTFDTWEVRE